MRKRNYLKMVTAVWGAVLSLSCTQVPQEVVELSMAVEGRITATQNSHEAFVAETFAQARARVENFMQYRWIPEYMADFVDRSNVVDIVNSPEPFDQEDIDRLKEELAGADFSASQRDRILRAVKNALGDAERGQVMLEFAEAAIEQINLQRSELMTPLEQMEKHSLEELRANYAELMSMQKTITQYLQSLREVKELEESVLKRVNLLEKRDEVVKKAVDLNDNIARVIAGEDKAVDTINKLKDMWDKFD